MNKLKRIMHEIKWSIMSGYYRQFIKPDSKILDVGAGEGYVSKLMQDSLKCRVKGVDVKHYGQKFVDISIIHDNKLPFKNKSFDVVTFNDILHHVNPEGQKKLLLEAKRIAKKIVILEDAKDIVSYVLDVLTNRPSMPKALSHKNVWEWTEFGKKIGLEFEYHKVRTPFYYPLKHYIFTIN